MGVIQGEDGSVKMKCASHLQTIEGGPVGYQDFCLTAHRLLFGSLLWKAIQMDDLLHRFLTLFKPCRTSLLMICSKMLLCHVVVPKMTSLLVLNCMSLMRTSLPMICSSLSPTHHLRTISAPSPCQLRTTCSQRCVLTIGV